MKKYSLTEAHRKELDGWAKKWIANAMSTEPMSEKEKETCRLAVRGLYEAAGLTPPPDHRIVFVPSPFVLRFAGGFAASIWHKRKRGDNLSATSSATRAATDSATASATYGATYEATYSATYEATYGATDSATHSATYEATYAATAGATASATREATRSATSSATRSDTESATSSATRSDTESATYEAIDEATRKATDSATYSATSSATDSATRAATDSATKSATDSATYSATYEETSEKWFNISGKEMAKLSNQLGVGSLGLKCAQNAYSMWQGGNQWSPWASFISFFRYIAKLDIDYRKWDHWEKLAVHSGPRIVHKEFCMISDRPKTLLVDEQNRPHNFDGPFCEWRDGSKLYSIRGIKIPMWIAETKREHFTKEMILSEKNADFRRCIVEKIGIEKTINLLGAKIIDSFQSNVGKKYELLEIDYSGDGTKRPYLKMENASLDGLYHIEGCKPGTKTVKEALAYRNGTKVFSEPQKIT